MIGKRTMNPEAGRYRHCASRVVVRILYGREKRRTEAVFLADRFDEKAANTLVIVKLESCAQWKSQTYTSTTGTPSTTLKS